jgi:hypothetical protein
LQQGVTPERHLRDNLRLQQLWSDLSDWSQRDQPTQHKGKKSWLRHDPHSLTRQAIRTLDPRGGSNRQGSKGRVRRWAEAAQLLLNQCNPQRPGLSSARTILVLQLNRVPSQPNHKLLSKHGMAGPDMLSHWQEAKAALTRLADKEGRLNAR